MARPSAAAARTGRGSVRGRLAVILLTAAMIVGLLPTTATDAWADEDPTRLLVTYAAPVDGAAEAGIVRTASLAAASETPSQVQVLEFDRAVDARAVAAQFERRADVVAVEPDQIIRPAGRIDRVLGTVDAAGTAAAGIVQAAGAGAATTASHLDISTAASSWGVRNTGQEVGGVPGRAGIDIGAGMVWPRTTGREVVVAIIDSGVDISHPLLRDRLWTNPGERRDGRDSDGNGFVDDIHGWNFVDGSPQVFRSEVTDAHGTHVAGIIAAASHVPVAFTPVAPEARLMVLRFIDGEGGRMSDAVAAIRYAADNGADLINASWSAPQPSTALHQAIVEARVPVVAAAGNLGTRAGAPVTYPAADTPSLPNLISVAAVNNAGRMPEFSSRSRTLVDLVAPGERILSTFPGARLAEGSGTSQAAPHVTGVLALALQRHPRTDPATLVALTNATVRPLDGAAETISGGLVRAPGLLDRLGTPVPACVTLPRVPFDDVMLGGAHHDAVACMLARGVTRGTSASTYGAADGLTRAQIATLLANALEPTGALPAAPASGRFGDLDGNLHRDNIEVLASIGVVRGVSATRYDPGGSVSRADFAAMVVRAAEWLATGEVRANGPSFDDTVGHPDAVEIRKAAGLVIITGRSAGVFDPDVPLRRDQAASMVTRLLNTLVQQGLLEVAV